jgi:hypothetical protein
MSLGGLISLSFASPWRRSSSFSKSEMKITLPSPWRTVRPIAGTPSGGPDSDRALISSRLA